uniref:winged helix-turn-helix domain-containing protein n=1 Tax=Parablautia intestinalis TaxID=2320100 RepID=UPI00259CACD9
GNPIDFTPKEYRTLLLFIKNSRLILTKTQLLEKLWDVDGNFVDEHTLTMRQNEVIQNSMEQCLSEC